MIPVMIIMPILIGEVTGIPIGLLLKRIGGKTKTLFLVMVVVWTTIKNLKKQVLRMLILN